ncbi:Putative solute carrier family 35 member F3/F4 [Colletotrichum destructivum]|uniref:Solute carrier family 35 member F3/F4 n=1 Tax=Colletotrichum destructivum TaxID=34406 RepID=A0AAX4IYF8_9PEZI|nr:Putative solute carrier family 35 member F3/F4 [Colletotrichum destructivum]
MPPRLTTGPDGTLNLPHSRLDHFQNPPLSATTCDSNISDYIGSGTTSPGQSPGLDERLAEFDALRTGNDEYFKHDEDDDDDDMDHRPPLLRNHHSRSGQPLLNSKVDDDDGRNYSTRSRGASPLLSPNRPAFSRGSTMRNHSPSTANANAKKKYIYAAFFLVLSLFSFVIQTELSAYIQQELHWDKAYCMLYLTHGSWAMLWPVQLLILRINKRKTSWPSFWRRHRELVHTTAIMVQRQDLDLTRPGTHPRTSPWFYLVRTTAFVTCALTVAGLSWYVAVNMTTPSDLTAIYNCSAFFAYVFSVPLLKEPLRMDKSLAVLVAIAGVLVVAYGDSSPADNDAAHNQAAGERLKGNLVIGVGSVLYGLYEVLYKRYACPPDGCSPGRGMVFANTFGSCIGAFTLTVLWIPLPILHWTGIEEFALPTGYTAWMLFFSVVMNATFAGSFLVLISLTSPVLSSVASLLTIFIVAITDWLRTGEPLSAAALLGGVMIMIAFGMLSWSTWREMTEIEATKAVDLTDSGEDSDRDERVD